MIITRLHNFLILFIPTAVLAVDPLVLLPNGYIRGKVSVTLENKTFYSFEKIPYATPPVGSLRFRPPQPAQNWDGILNTTLLDVICHQTYIDLGIESEDCLYINVFTPQLPDEGTKPSLPVLFAIHGGGFYSGASFILGPDHFINRDVVVVTINYRLGPFGFLSTQDEVVPGNNGLKDQLLALQWTHTNIHLFGGDPEKITIHGESAGSASVAYFLLNQQTAGLFNGAIMQSGTFLSPWAYQRDAKAIAFATAALLNDTFSTSNNSQDLLEFLQSVPAKDLDWASNKYHENETPENLQVAQGLFWAPVIEIENPNAFITEKMYGLLKSGKIVAVPILIGTNSEEGIAFNTDSNVLETTLRYYDDHLGSLVPHDMGLTEEDKRTEMGQMIREIYTNGEPIADHLGAGIRYSSDTCFTRSIIKTAELYSKFSKTYFYQFSYDGELGHFDVHYDGAENVTHGEEMYYLFCSGFGCDLSSYSETDQLVQNRFIEMWTNFVKYRNPTPEPSDLLQNVTWPSLTTDEDNFLYLDIGNNLEVKNHPKNNTYQKWVELYNSLGYDNFDTY